MQITNEYHTTIFLPYQDKDDKIKKQESKNTWNIIEKQTPSPYICQKILKLTVGINGLPKGSTRGVGNAKGQVLEGRHIKNGCRLPAHCVVLFISWCWFVWLKPLEDIICLLDLFFSSLVEKFTCFIFTFISMLKKKLFFLLMGDSFFAWNLWEKYFFTLPF